MVSFAYVMTCIASWGYLQTIKNVMICMKVSFACIIICEDSCKFSMQVIICIIYWYTWMQTIKKWYHLHMLWFAFYASWGYMQTIKKCYILHML